MRRGLLRVVEEWELGGTTVPHERKVYLARVCSGARGAEMQIRGMISYELPYREHFVASGPHLLGRVLPPAEVRLRTFLSTAPGNGGQGEAEETRSCRHAKRKQINHCACFIWRCPVWRPHIRLASWGRLG